MLSVSEAHGSRDDLTLTKQRQAGHMAGDRSCKLNKVSTICVILTDSTSRMLLGFTELHVYYSEPLSIYFAEE